MAQEEIELAKVQEVKEANEEKIFSLANVVGVGVGYKEKGGKEIPELCMKVFVEKKMDKKDLTPTEVVPPLFNDVKTDVQEVGRIEALTFKDKIRPVKPGYSMGHFKITAGTFGCLVREVCPPCSIHILSNNHVLANSNASSIGDPILQPGPVDGGTYP